MIACDCPACEWFQREFDTPLDMPRAAFAIVLSTDMHHFSLQNLRLLSQTFVSSTEDIQHSHYERLLEATAFRRRYALSGDVTGIRNILLVENLLKIHLCLLAKQHSLDVPIFASTTDQLKDIIINHITYHGQCMRTDSGASLPAVY
jgi:hypothetical protein